MMTKEEKGMEDVVVCDGVPGGVTVEADVEVVISAVEPEEEIFKCVTSVCENTGPADKMYVMSVADMKRRGLEVSRETMLKHLRCRECSDNIREMEKKRGIKSGQRITFFLLDEQIRHHEKNMALAVERERQAEEFRLANEALVKAYLAKLEPGVLAEVKDERGVSASDVHACRYGTCIAGGADDTMWVPMEAIMDAAFGRSVENDDLRLVEVCSVDVQILAKHINMQTVASAKASIARRKKDELDKAREAEFGAYLDEVALPEKQKSVEQPAKPQPAVRSKPPVGCGFILSDGSRCGVAWCLEHNHPCKKCGFLIPKKYDLCKRCKDDVPLPPKPTPTVPRRKEQPFSNEQFQAIKRLEKLLVAGGFRQSVDRVVTEMAEKVIRKFFDGAKAMAEVRAYNDYEARVGRAIQEFSEAWDAWSARQEAGEEPKEPSVVHENEAELWERTIAILCEQVVVDTLADYPDSFTKKHVVALAQGSGLSHDELIKLAEAEQCRRQQERQAELDEQERLRQDEANKRNRPGWGNIRQDGPRGNSGGNQKPPKRGKK